MTVKVANLILEMAANVASLKKDLAEHRRVVGSTMDFITKSANLAAKALGAIGAGLSLSSWIRGAIDAADAINDMSKATGIAGTTLFGLQYAAKMSGTTLDDTASAINKLSVSIGGNASKYEALGISAKDPIEAFKQLADVFKATEDPQQRAVLAAEAIGKSWQGIAPLLSEGSDGIQELIDSGIRLYGVTPEIIDGAARFNDQLDILAMRSQAAALSLIGPFLNSIVTSMEEMEKAKQISGGFISALFTFGAMNPFGTLEDGITRYKDEIEELEKAIVRYQKSNSDTKALEESIDAVKKRLEFTQYRLNQQISEQSRAQRDAASASDAHIAAYSKMKVSADELISQMTFESSLLGMTNDEREKSVALRKLEEIGIRSGSSALDEYLPKLNEILEKNKDTRKRIQAEMDAEAAARQAASEAKRLIEERQRAVKSIEDEIAQLKFETEYMGKSNLEKDQAIFLQKLQNAGIDEGTESWKKYAEAYQAALIDKNQMQAVIDANKKIEDEKKKLADKAIADRLKKEEEFADEIKSINNQIGQSLTDALMTGGTNARDFLVNMFRTMVLRPMLQPVITGVVGAFTASALTNNAVAAEGVASAGSVSNSFGLMSMASNLKSAYTVVTTGFTSLGSAVGEFVTQMAGIDSAVEALILSPIGSDAATAAAAQIEAATSMGAAASSIASIAAGVGAGLGIGNLLSNGKSLVGGSSWSTVGGGTALGAAIGSIVPGLGTALGAALGGSIGGLINAAFGMGSKENTDSGIIGKLSASNTQGLANYQEWERKGGWFRSGDSGSDWTNIDPKIQKYMNNAVATTAIAVRQYADILKLPAKGIAEFSFEIKQSLVGLTAEEAQKQIDLLLAAYGNALAATVTAEIGPFQREGEEAGATLARLANSLQGVNNVLDTLNLRLLDTSLYGADAASKLADMFGGLDKFVAATDAYYQAYYSEQERAVKTTEQLAGVFNQLGLQMPQTNAGFRALVESARAAGNDGLFAALIKLAPAFNGLTTALTQVVDSAFSALQGAIQTEMQTALATIDKQKALADTAKQVASESMNSLRSIFDYLKGQVADILGSINTLQTSAQGMSFVRTALENAQMTGYLPDQTLLSDAVSAARAGLSSENFATAYEMKRGNMLLAADLQQLQDIAGDQMSTAELQLKVAEDQYAFWTAQADSTQLYYSNQLQMAQNQVNELRGINGGILTVADAMASFGAAVNASRMAAAASSGSDMTAQVSQMYLDILGRAPDAGGLASWLNSGLSLEEIRAGIMNSEEKRLRGYASGGLYPGGLAMVGENGPELINFARPGMVYNAAQTNSLLSGDSVAEEVRALREENQVQSRAIVQLQSRLTRIFERWDGAGLPSTRVEA